MNFRGRLPPRRDGPGRPPVICRRPRWTAMPRKKKEDEYEIWLTHDELGVTHLIPVVKGSTRVVRRLDERD